MYDYGTIISLQRETNDKLDTINQSIETGFNTCMILLSVIVIAILAYGAHDILNHALGRGE